MLITGELRVTPQQRVVLEAARREFAADVIFLNSATMGLPPRRTVEAVQTGLAEWTSGRAEAPAYDVAVSRARSLYADFVGVDPSLVAVGGQVSVFAGLIAASLPAGSEVLTASGDFTSIVFPFHVLAGRGITVREVPLDRIADAVTKSTSLVSVSAVQSADGRVADLDALSAACDAVGARILLDTTQAVGWLPVDASRYAYTVSGGYKWQLIPRGTAFLTIHRDLLDEVAPLNAGWYAGGERWSSIYGAPLRLATDARRFDISPAWLCWMGAVPSLELLTEVGIDALHAACGRSGPALQRRRWPSGSAFGDRLGRRRCGRSRADALGEHRRGHPSWEAPPVVSRLDKRAGCRQGDRRPLGASAPVVSVSPQWSRPGLMKEPTTR